jgi:hypothetical protein
LSTVWRTSEVGAPESFITEVVDQLWGKPLAADQSFSLGLLRLSA